MIGCFVEVFQFCLKLIKRQKTLPKLGQRKGTCVREEWMRNGFISHVVKCDSHHLFKWTAPGCPGLLALESLRLPLTSPFPSSVFATHLPPAKPVVVNIWNLNWRLKGILPGFSVTKTPHGWWVMLCFQDRNVMVWSILNGLPAIGRRRFHGFLTPVYRSLICSLDPTVPIVGCKQCYGSVVYALDSQGVLPNNRFFFTKCDHQIPSKKGFYSIYLRHKMLED